MDSAPPQPSSNSSVSVSQLPPEAVALAGRIFDAARNGDEQSIALLTSALQRGLPANLTNDKGDTLIMLSAYHGHTNLVRLLLQYNADPNCLNDRGQSPLAGVVFKNERGCIEALLEGGADPEIGTPSAIEACRVFKMEEYEGMFKAQIERLRGSGGRAVNGDGMNSVDVSGS